MTNVNGTSSYAYDALGQRVERIVSGVTSDYVFDNAGHENTAGSAGFAGWSWSELYMGGMHINTYTNGSTYFAHADHLGTLRTQSDPTGNTNGSYFRNLPFGDWYDHGTQGWLGFTGDLLDDPDGNNFHTASREYEEYEGRWLTPDPSGRAAVDITNPQSWNRYAYAGNNPVSSIDPTGLDFEMACSSLSPTCQQQTVGYDANGTAQMALVQGTTDAQGNFTPTLISNDENGNLVDQNGNEYNASVGPNGVSFTQAGVENATSSGGVFVNGTDPTTIQGSGDLEGFTFTFTNSKLEANQTAAGTFTFSGTPDQAGAALQQAGFTFQLLGQNAGMNEYRSPGSFLTGAGSGHFNVYEIDLDPGGPVSHAQGNMHFGEHNPGNPFGFLAHCLLEGACQ